MMRWSSLLLAGAAALGIAVMIGGGGAGANPTANCQTPLAGSTQLAQTEDSKPLACCFEGAESETCTISSPNQMGCEWTMLYQCKDGKYTCDADTQICTCDEPGAGATSTP